MVEEEIDVRIVAGVVASGRAEQVKMLHTKLSLLGLVFPEPGHGFGARHYTILVDHESLMQTARRAWPGPSPAITVEEFMLSRCGFPAAC